MLGCDSDVRTSGAAMDKRLKNDQGAGYFLYHSIGMYPGKVADLEAEMSAFAQSWGALDDEQWGYALLRRKAFVDLWRGLLNAPRGSMTTCENVTSGLATIIAALPEGEGVVVGDMDPARLAQVRQDLPALKHRVM